MGDAGWQVIARTEDSDDPVLRGRLPSGSYTYVILDQANRRLNIYLVKSFKRGEMKVLIDEVVRHTGWTSIRFLTPLDDLKPDGVVRLIDRLEGFEHIKFDPGENRLPNGPAEMEAYDGEWRL